MIQKQHNNKYLKKIISLFFLLIFITPTYATIFNEQTEYSTTNIEENILFIDNFNTSLNWSTSDNTVYIKDNNYLYTTTDGRYDDWAEKTFNINLSKNYNIIIEQRMKIESGGWGYRLPLQKIIFENNYILDVTYLSETNYGWNFDGWTKKQEPIIPGTGYWTSSTANYWTITKIIINSTGGELQIKPDDVEKNWHSNEFIKVIAKNWTHEKINKIIFRQTWDSVNYIDYIKITKEPITSTPTYPTPLENATILVAGNNWQDLSLAQSTGKDVIFTDKITDKIKNELKNTDQLWFFGDIENIEELNATKIQKITDINNIFFNTTNSYYTDKKHAILATLLAAKNNIPLTFENNNAEDLTKYTNEQLTTRYLINQKENIDNIIITNTDTPLAFIAPQLSKKYQAIPLITTITTPTNNITQNQIKNKLTSLALKLSQNGLYAKNKDHKIKPIYITILGDFNAIPPYQMDDKGREYIGNIDGNILLSDLPYADFYNDGKIDASIGRITNKNQLYTLEKITKTKILSQYRHGKYADVIFLGGGMMQGYDTHRILKKENINTERNVESRVEISLGTLNETVTLSKKLYNFAKKTGDHSLKGFLGFIKTFMDLASMIMSIFFEADWNHWDWYLLQLPPHLDNLNTSTFQSLENTQILTFFGVGNKDEITMHKQERKEWELLIQPYKNGQKITNLNYNNFFMMDYDMSGYMTNANIPTQITNLGAYGFATTGIIHDPYSWSFTSPTIRYITQGNTLGEAMLNTIKNKPYEKYMKFMPHKYIGNALFDLETKNTYERILLGNPKTKLFQEQTNTYLTENTITSTNEQTQKQSKTLTLKAQTMPQTTYTITKTITNNYEIINNTIKNNANEYILYPGFPVISVKTTIIPLPQNANLQTIKFNPIYDTHNNLNIMYIPYDQYYNQTLNTIDEQFPKINYTYEIYNNPDNTKEIHIITPLEIHNNKTTNILSKATIKITYTSPMEITNIVAKNTTITNNATIEITITSNINENGILYLYIDNQEYKSKNIQITPNTNTYTFNINTPNLGRHAATIIYDGNTSIPAKHANFYVFNPIFTLQPPANLNKDRNQKSTIPFKFSVHDKMTGLFILDESCIIKTNTQQYPCGKKQDTTKINNEEERYHTNIETKTLDKGTNLITANILGTTKTFEITIK